MRRLDEITLRKVTLGMPASGVASETVAEAPVWADIKGVKRQEHYAAQAIGQRVDIVFHVRAEDYDQQGEAAYDGVIYKIARAYPVSAATMELICTRRG